MRYLTAGESHGEALVVIIEGIPAGVHIEKEELEEYLKERQNTAGRSDRQKIEKPEIKILSGIVGGYTIGSPISIVIPNFAKEQWYKLEPIRVPRPGHADLPGGIKYNFTDFRYVWERASARDTAARTVAAGVAAAVLKELNIFSLGYTIQIDGIKANIGSYEYSELKKLIEEDKELRCPDRDIRDKMRNKIKEVEERQDTVGGIFEVSVFGLPAGLGSYTHWDLRLDAKIAYSILSIPGVKGIEFGLGFQFTNFQGSQIQDKILYDKNRGFYRSSNYAGGIEGGMTNGETLIFRGVIKPPPTLSAPDINSVDIFDKSEKKSPRLRGDVCVVPAAAKIAEGLAAIEILSAIEDKFGADTKEDLKKNYKFYIERCKKYPFTTS